MSGDLESKTGRGRRGSRRATNRSRAPGGDSSSGDSSSGVSSEDSIDEAGRESFPASDPPTWTLGVEPRKATH